MTYDPCGPGTPAWEAADNAITAWQQWRATGQSTKHKLYTRYRNQVHYMVQQLRRYRSEAEIEQWKRFVKTAKKDPDWS